MNFVTIEGKQYIKSQNIRVFPCAYRGYYNSSTTPVTTLVFDPEARAITEANFTNTFHKLSNNKESYVIAWIPDSVGDVDSTGTLKCVIGGYYFEIYNHAMSDFFYTDRGIKKPYYLCIRAESIALGTAELDSRETKVLSPFSNTESYLDVKQNNDYAFTGLLISTSQNGDDNATASLAPFMISGYTQVGTYTSEANTTNLYYLNTDKEFVLISDTSLAEGTPLYAEDTSYKLDPSKLPITNLLDVGNGNYSIQMIEDITVTGTNTTVASGDYSISLGLSTEASAKASTAFGNNTTASGKGAISVGNHTKSSGEGSMTAGNSAEASGKGSVAAGTTTEASGDNAVALGNATKATGANAVALGNTTTASGDNAVALGTSTEASGSNAVALGDSTKAKAPNQVVIGAHNKIDNNQAFIIANGTARGKSNVFTVGYNGDVKALGNLEVKGSICSTLGSSNDFILGTTASGSSGTITVYGTSASTTPIFKVTNTGNTTIAGTTSITNDTPSGTPRTGALTVAGGAGILGNLNVGGITTIHGTSNLQTLNVGGAATLNNTLTVAKTTTLNDILNVNKKATFNAPVEITGDTKITATTAAESTTTGALVVTGGVGIGKRLHVGDDLSVKGVTLLHSRTAIQGDTQIANGTDSTSADTGALKVTGGVGIGKTLNVGGAMTVGSTVTVAGATTIKAATTISGITTINNATDYANSDGTHSAACIINGGVYVAKKLHVNGDTTFRDNLEIAETRVAIKKETESTAANNGALVVNGGVGIGKDLNIAGNSNIAGNLTIAGTSGKSNILQLGNESTANKGGELKIYGTGTDTIFEVDKTGNVTAEGDLSVTGQISAGGKLNIDKTIEISATGISGLPGLTVSGQINALTFNATSDARLKTNVEDYIFEKSILDLPIKQFEYIKDDTHTKYIGCLAQDLQEICPALVNENADGVLSIQESKLVYALIQEVKTLKQKVDQLERK